MRAGSRGVSGVHSVLTTKLGVYGHVDAGKTALIQHLLGCKTRKFEHEARRAITTTLGSTHFSIERVGGEFTVNFDNRGKSFCVVDTPGHMAYRHRSQSSIRFIDVAMLVCDVSDTRKSPVTGLNRFVHLFEFHHRRFMAIVSKIDLVPIQCARAVARRLPALVGEPVHFHSTKSQLARQNLLARLYALGCNATPPAEFANGIVFCALKSFNPNRIGTSVHELKGAVLGGIGRGLSVNDRVFVHDLQSVRQSRRVVVESRVIGIRRDGKRVSRVADPSFHTVELSMCPDLGAQDGLAGVVLSGKRLPGAVEISGRVVQCYGAIKRKMHVKIQLWGRIIAGDVLSASKRVIKIRLSRPMYRVSNTTRFSVYGNDPGVIGLLAMVQALPPV